MTTVPVRGAERQPPGDAPSSPSAPSCTLCRLRVTSSKPVSLLLRNGNLKIDLQGVTVPCPWLGNQPGAVTRKTFPVKTVFIEAIFHLYTDSKEKRAQKLCLLAVLQLFGSGRSGP